MTKERRRYTRVRLASGPEAGELEPIDLSLGGMFLRSAKPLAEGRRVQIALQLPGATRPVEVRGQVVRVETRNDSATGVGMAIEFDELSAEARDEIARLAPSPRRETGPVTAPAETDHRIARLEEAVARLEAEVAALKNALAAREHPTEAAAPARRTPATLGADPVKAAPLVPSPPSPPGSRPAGSARPPAFRLTPLASVPASLDRTEFESLLRAGQKLERTQKLKTHEPTDAADSVLASWLDRASDLASLAPLASGRFAETQLIERLFAFYRRGLVEFA